MLCLLLYYSPLIHRLLPKRCRLNGRISESLCPKELQPLLSLIISSHLYRLYIISRLIASERHIIIPHLIYTSTSLFHRLIITMSTLISSLIKPTPTLFTQLPLCTLENGSREWLAVVTASPIDTPSERRR